MTLIDALSLTLVLALGLRVLAWLVRLFFSPLISIIRSWRGQRASESKVIQLQVIDRSIEEGNFLQALTLIEQAVTFVVPTTQAEISQTFKTHQALLTRWVALEERGVLSLKNLAHLEQLFEIRAELGLQLLKSKDSLQRLSNQRKEKNKELPQWTKDDFTAKQKQSLEKLKQNEKEIREALESFKQTLSQSQSPTLH